MRAAVIFFLALVMRAAMVDSWTRKARATSAVDSPHSSRRVSATWASRARAGWQQVKISRSRSSSIGCTTSTGGWDSAELVQDQQRHHSIEHGVATEQVTGAVAGDRGQPRAGPVGDA